jgi:UDP-N-acetylmuramate-alanine ligase
MTVHRGGQRFDIDRLLDDPRKHIVVCCGSGGVGKTTTAALMAHVLVAAGTDPSFLVGGVTANYSGNFRLGNGPFVVVEGDEYDTAYFDKGPKFLHYRARTALLTSVEFDHADIYRDMAHYESAFERFARTLPADGLLAVCASYPNAVALARSSADPMGRTCWMPSRWFGVSMNPPVPGAEASRNVSGENQSEFPVELTICCSVIPASRSRSGSTSTCSPRAVCHKKAQWP